MVPRIQFEAAFKEEAVFHAVKAEAFRGREDLGDSFIASKDRLYQIPEGEEREKAFLKFHDDFFEELGIQKFFEGIVGEFPMIQAQNAVIWIKQTWDAKKEGAELYVEGPKRTVLVALCVSRFAEREKFAAYLRQELFHISDMLDPAFQYSPNASWGGTNQIEDDLIRDRFRLLWDISVSSRIRRQGLGTWVDAEREKENFERAFFLLDVDRRERIFQEVTAGRPLPHAQLLEWAREGVLAPDRKGVRRCPLCSFMSFEILTDWAGEKARAAREVEKDFPQWTPSQGSCPHCFELYRSRVKLGV